MDEKDRKRAEELFGRKRDRSDAPKSNEKERAELLASIGPGECICIPLYDKNGKHAGYETVEKV